MSSLSTVSVHVKWRSGHNLAEARPATLDITRLYLREADSEANRDLAAADDRDLLTRLSRLNADGRLSNARSLLFVGTSPFTGIDYMRRDKPGSGSTNRIEGTGPLVEQLRRGWGRPASR